jgi:hypothetical protein
MFLEALSPLSFIVGIVVSYAASNFFNSREVRTQQDVLKHGLVAEGRVTAVTGMLDRRVYFEFQPRGNKSLVQCCQVDRRDTAVTSLPSVGTRVAVRYLPENPRRAVIAKLVTRFIRD